MEILVILFCAAAAMADRLENVYLPPSGASAAGGSAGALRGPAASHQGPDNYARNTATILRQEQEINEQGFHYNYETSDGTKAEQQGRVIPGTTEDSGSLAVQGSYSYVGTDGQTYSITYTADENGYRAEGAHLPTPPPIPEAILKSLQLTARGDASAHSQGQYQSQQSSYDADSSGYRY